MSALFQKGNERLEKIELKKQAREDAQEADIAAITNDELLELLDDIGIAYLTCTHHPLTHIEYGTPAEINNSVVC